MGYKFETQHNAPAYTRANRTAADISEIVIHHWDDYARRPTYAGSIDWQCRAGSQAAGHYTLEAGRVACLVDPKNIAWHAGSWAVNQRSLGLECNPRWSDADYQTAAELIANLRAEFGEMKLSAHRWYYSTSCPGTVDLDRLDKLARGIKAAPPKKAPAAPATAVYTVVAGDTVSLIAYTFNTTVTKLKQLNKGLNPDLIKVGQKVKVPAAGTYKVKAGDTLSGIGSAKGLDWKKLADKNGLRSPYTIHAGQLLSLK